MGIREMRTLIKRLAEERKITVFMSSHLLGEVQQLATRIEIIHEGRLVEEVDHEELRRRSRTYLEIQVSEPDRAVWALEEKLKLQDFSVHEESRIRIYESLDRAGEINRVLTGEGILVSRLNVHEENLEDYFIKLVGQGANGDGGVIENEKNASKRIH